jgi:hypothetical protein
MYVQCVVVVLRRGESWPLHPWEGQRLNAVEMKVLMTGFRGDFNTLMDLCIPRSIL